MAFKLLDNVTIRRILDALHPRFVGRDQDHLIVLADESGAIAYEAAQTYVQPLYDFRNDIESTAGASLVGVNDAGAYYTGVNVEAVLQELPSKFLAAGTVYVASFNGRTGAVAPAAGDYTFAQIGSKPTTLAGYGITDAAPLSHVGAGGTAHANVVASGAAGFMTGADKAKLDGVAAGATANTGTVTSVAVANATGITWTGSPITTSGTLTPTLSTNLQAWSGLATSAKQDASANLTSWSGITPATKADDSAVVHLTGNETVAGNKTFSGTTALATSSTVNTQPIGYRNIPLSTQSAAYTLVATDAGTCIQKTGTSAINYTVNGSVFSTGDVVTLVNNGSAGAVTIVQGTGMTLRLAGPGTTGNRTLAAFGMCTIYFVSATGAYVSGTGLT